MDITDKNVQDWNLRHHCEGKYCLNQSSDGTLDKNKTTIDEQALDPNIKIDEWP